MANRKSVSRICFVFGALRVRGSPTRRLRVTEPGRTSPCCEKLFRRSEMTCLNQQYLVAVGGKLGSRDSVKPPQSISAGKKACCSGTTHSVLAQPAFPWNSLLHHPRHAQTPIRKLGILRSFESLSLEVFAEYGNQEVFQTLPKPKPAECSYR
ncbi:hypothetical protein DL95DRAFT_135172 [Leptodontidium sp. 2 PMI_412]|nr:hypothetical protein DL95DRAFT_135172 [Leptodontidium sp. 2 PMI_412]